MNSEYFLKRTNLFCQVFRFAKDVSNLTIIMFLRCFRCIVCLKFSADSLEFTKCCEYENIVAARAEIAFDRVGGELLKSLLLSFFNGQVKEGRK